MNETSNSLFDASPIPRYLQLADVLRGRIMRGEWRSTAPFKGKRGRHLNGIYRLIGKKRHHQTYLHEFVADYLEAKRSDETYKVWVNTFLALAYEQQGETIHHSILYNRREGYGPQLPNKVLLLAAGVDIQESPPRIEAELRGFGLGEESWGVEYVQFQGDPRQQEVWQKLDEWLLQSRVREDGTELKVHCVGVDTGRFTKQAYEFCRARQMRRIYAVKGRGGSGLPIASLPRKSGVTRVRLFTIGTDTAKHLIYGRLTLGAHGKGYYHFPEDYPESYFDGLTAEVILTKWVNGRPARVFANPQQKRNEPLDINVYILGALAISQVNLERLAKALPPREPEATEATTEVVEDGDEPAPSLVVEPVQEAQAQTVTANPPVAVAETPVRRVRQPRVSGWVNKWRT